MTNDQSGQDNLTRMPRQALDRFTKPFFYFLDLYSASGIVLLLFTIAALVLSNSPWKEPFLGFWEIEAGFNAGSIEYSRSLRDWINDGLMTFFFFLVALELKRELVLGELKSPRLAAFSIAAALGGMMLPAALYLVLQWSDPTRSAWGLVMATDTAFVIACLALLGSRIPHSLRVFMLSLAIVDDVGAIMVVAIGYSADISWNALALAGVIIGGILAFSLMGLRNIACYYLMGGLLWLAIDTSGIHATITGVILGLMTPARRLVNDERLYAILEEVVAHPSENPGSGDTRDRNTLLLAEIAARETLSPLERLEIALHPWVGFVIMPLFAFANAGMSVNVLSVDIDLAVAVFISFLVGKPLGIFVFSWLAIRMGVALRPEDLNWKLIVGGGFLAGIGFTMALFIAGLSLPGSELDSAKIGIFLASLSSAIVGICVLVWATRRHS